MTRGKRWVIGVAVILVGGLLSVVPASVSAATGPIAWPEETILNPHATPYTITVNDAGGVGTLIAQWRPAEDQVRELVLPHEGDVTLPFAESADNFSTTVYVYRCPGTVVDRTCASAGYSRPLRIYVEADTTPLVGGRGAIGPTAQALSFSYVPEGLGTTSWRLLAADGAVLQTGTTPLSTRGEIVVSVPAGTPEQRGSLEMVITLDGTAVGHLEGTQVLLANIDGVAPPPPVISTTGSVIYSYDDGYLDSVGVTVSTTGARTVEVVAVNEATGVVHSVLPAFPRADPYTFEFAGRDSRRRSLPPGTYRLRAVATDAGDNSSTGLGAPIEVRAERLRQDTWTRTVPAAKTIVKKFVGDCSTLHKPASRGWRGSLGYYSATRCRRPKESFVQVVHGIYVPQSVLDKYTRMRISLTGGPSRGRAGSYLILGYYSDNKPWRFTNRSVHRGSGVGIRRGASVVGGQVNRLVHDRFEDRPFVAWSTGLTAGSRYDVKSFTVQLTRQVLELPDSRRGASHLVEPSRLPGEVGALGQVGRQRSGFDI
ncbi:hypothetical protein [Nocardioides astragali]|uniref:Uncharacterized protein n=1 Tax=Nocardioides astragali TaxID=1776736 RepID=A0ABW2N4P6_9ACTN|nr:hypothetical protein [Nocardioides astragali]